MPAAWYPTHVLEQRERTRQRGERYRAVGLANEWRLLQAVRTIATWIPDVILCARLAFEDEDQTGVDVVVLADVGYLFLQAKSSEGGAKHYLQSKPKNRRPNVAVVIVQGADETVLARTAEALDALRNAVRTV